MIAGKPVTESSLFAECVARGIIVDSHASDLYIPDTRETRDLCRHFGHKPEAFLSYSDRTLWLDVPFAFDPFWDKKTGQAG